MDVQQRPTQVQTRPMQASRTEVRGSAQLVALDWSQLHPLVVGVVDRESLATQRQLEELSCAQTGKAQEEEVVSLERPAVDRRRHSLRTSRLMHTLLTPPPPLPQARAVHFTLPTTQSVLIMFILSFPLSNCSFRPRELFRSPNCNQKNLVSAYFIFWKSLFFVRS